MEFSPRRSYFACCTRPGLRVHRPHGVLIVLLYVAGAREGLYVSAATARAWTMVPAPSAAEKGAQVSQGADLSARSSAASFTESTASARPPGVQEHAGTATRHSKINYNVDNVTHEEERKSGYQVGSHPRRLALSRAILSTLAQYYFHSDMRRSLKRAGYRMAELVRGIPTADYELNYFHQKEKCLTTFDFTNDWGVLGPVDVDSIEVKFLPAQHRGVLSYVESRDSRVKFLKPIQRHVQNFLLPHGCTATTNSTWTAYCTTVDPPCIVGRIDILSSTVSAEEPLVPLHPVNTDEFNGKLLADGWEWYDVQDLYEGVPDYPKPLHMTWDGNQCMLHVYFETKAIEKTQFYWMKSRQAFQIIMEQIDGTPYRKMSAFPPSCGGRKAKDFAVTVKKLEPEGNYKAVMSTQVYGENITADPDEVVLQGREPLVPLEDWDPYEDEVDFIQLFPDANAVPLYELASGPYE